MHCLSYRRVPTASLHSMSPTVLEAFEVWKTVEGSFGLVPAVQRLAAGGGGEQVRVVGRLHAQRVQAPLQELVLAGAVPLQLRSAAVLVPKKLLHGAAAADVQDAVQGRRTKLVALLEHEVLDACCMLFQVGAQSLGQENCLWAHLHSPVKLFVLSICLDCLPGRHESPSIKTNRRRVHALPVALPQQ